MKTSLILEGGGMRGAYTAGALSWLIDNNIEFDAAYGISTGAVHLCNYLMKDKKNLFDFSVDHITNKKAIGLSAFLRCGHIVDYKFLFNDLMQNKLGFSLKALNNCKTQGKVGVYEFNTGKCEYHPVQSLDIEELKAACTLPIIGGYVSLGDRKMMDGGISDMIPIMPAVKDGCDRHIIITTKPLDYVRKPANSFVVWLMSVLYKECPSIAYDYKIRHLNYQKQLAQINDLTKQGKAIYIYPSRSSNVSRLGGSRQELTDIYNLGWQDMESKKEIIFKLLGK